MNRDGYIYLTVLGLLAAHGNFSLACSAYRRNWMNRLRIVPRKYCQFRASRAGIEKMPVPDETARGPPER